MFLRPRQVTELVTRPWTWARGLSSNSRHGATGTAFGALVERVRAFLAPQRLSYGFYQCLVASASSHSISETLLAIIGETGAQASLWGKSHAVTAFAEALRDRSDEPNKVSFWVYSRPLCSPISSRTAALHCVLLWREGERLLEP